MKTTFGILALLFVVGCGEVLPGTEIPTDSGVTADTGKPVDVYAGWVGTYTGALSYAPHMDSCPNPPVQAQNQTVTWVLSKEISRLINSPEFTCLRANLENPFLFIPQENTATLLTGMPGNPGNPGDDSNPIWSPNYYAYMPDGKQIIMSWNEGSLTKTATGFTVKFMEHDTFWDCVLDVTGTFTKQ